MVLSNTLISPTELADSLLKTTYSADRETVALGLLCAGLSVYGYDATHMIAKHLPNKPSAPITDTRHKATKFTRHNTQYLYCKKCTSHNNPVLAKTYGGNFQCTVIGTVLFPKTNDVTDNKEVILTSLYPHPTECCNSTLHMNNETGGWAKIPFDFESIIGKSLDRIIHNISGLTSADLGNGDNKYAKLLTSGSDEQPHDRRFFIPIDPFKSSDIMTDEDTSSQDIVNDTHGLLDDTFVKEFQQLRTRLTLFLANQRGIETELQFEKPHHPDNIGLHWKPLLEEEPHLSLVNPSVLFGGYMPKHKGRGKQLAVNQIPHCDFGAVNGTALSDNIHLRNKTLPCTVLLPLLDHRTLMIYKDDDDKTVQHEVKANKGELIIFDGDVSHGGYTYLETTPLQLHPCLHFYMYSTLHKSDLSSFDVDVHATCNLADQFATVLKSNKYTMINKELPRRIADVDHAYTRLNKAGLLNDEVKKESILAMEELLCLMKTGTRMKLRG